jgi:predicted nucleic acid-binding protein
MEINPVDQIPDGASDLMDTNPINYLFEGNTLKNPFNPVFEALNSRSIQALVTPVTLPDVISGPLKAGKETLAERYRQALCSGRGWSLREIHPDIAVVAARLRLRYRLRLPDAIQAAVAVHAGRHALAAHDRDFQSLTDLLVLGIKSPGVASSP